MAGALPVEVGMASCVLQPRGGGGHAFENKLIKSKPWLILLGSQDRRPRSDTCNVPQGGGLQAGLEGLEPSSPGPVLGTKVGSHTGPFLFRPEV